MRIIQDSDDEGGGLSDASPIRPSNEVEAPPTNEGLAVPIAASMNGTSSSGVIILFSSAYLDIAIAD